MVGFQYSPNNCKYRVHTCDHCSFCYLNFIYVYIIYTYIIYHHSSLCPSFIPFFLLFIALRKMKKCYSGSWQALFKSHFMFLAHCLLLTFCEHQGWTLRSFILLCSFNFFQNSSKPTELPFPVLSFFFFSMQSLTFLLKLCFLFHL